MITTLPSFKLKIKTNYSDSSYRNQFFNKVIITLLLISSTFCFKLSAQVAKIGTSASASATNTIASFTVPAGTNRLLIVTASDAGSTDIISVTFNGTNMIESKEVNDGTAVDAIYTLALGTSASSTTGSIVITSSTLAHIDKVITANVFEKVNQTTSLSSILGTQGSTTPSSSTLNVTSNAGDLVFDLFDTWKSTAGSTHSAGSGQTLTQATTAMALSYGFGWISTSTKAGANSVSMSRSTTDHIAMIHIAFNIKSDNVVLPVNLKSFNTLISNKQPKLVWTTVSEVNFDYFEVEKRLDGTEFYSIGKVFSKNNIAGSDYEYNALDEAFGQQYYRLKVVDLDGTYKYSSIVFLKTGITEALSLKVFPNPTVSSLTIDHPKANSGSIIKIISLDGKIISSHSISIDATQTKISVESLVSSNYLVIFENNGELMSSRFVKQ